MPRQKKILSNTRFWQQVLIFRTVGKNFRCLWQNLLAFSVFLILDGRKKTKTKKATEILKKSRVFLQPLKHYHGLVHVRNTLFKNSIPVRMLDFRLERFCLQVGLGWTPQTSIRSSRMSLSDSHCRILNSVWCNSFKGLGATELAEMFQSKIFLNIKFAFEIRRHLSF